VATEAAPLCGCGSGLRGVRCCGADAAALVVLPAARHLQALMARAQESFGAGDRPAAEGLVLEVLELVPGHHDALRLLFELRRMDRPQAADILLRRLVALFPNDLWATNELTLWLMNRNLIGEAEIHARDAVRIAPENPQSHHLMGMIMTEANRPRIGEYHYRRSLELSRQRPPILLANLAWNLKNQGRMAEARALYRESVAAAPDILQTLLGWARLEEADRDFPAAAALLDKAATVAPGNQNVLLARAVLHGRTRKHAAALDVLDAIAAQRGDGTLGPNELLEKGRLFDQMGRFDDAFAAFDQGKRLMREISGTQYLSEHAAELTQRLKGFFTVPRLRFTPRAGRVEGMAQPLFILGFPRSGTTLVEQTLTAHPAISAGDELPFINEITNVMPRMLNSPLSYPEALAELWMGDQREGLDNLRDYYLQRVRQLDIIEPGARWFTDKMPLNETHLGLIALLFPEAPLLHVHRHPLDVVLSVFSNALTHGFFCAYALESAARHYAVTMELVEHYRAEMALRYLPVRYEDIVDTQRRSIERILGFIGEEFDETCLNFHENKRYARTASYAQVTEKLYDRSRYRYRAYLKHLEPVIPILEPVIRRLGYTIEAAS
jgi:tetratricopeptide (TPR) repeat protein